LADLHARVSEIDDRDRVGESAAVLPKVLLDALTFQDDVLEACVHGIEEQDDFRRIGCSAVVDGGEGRHGLGTAVVEQGEVLRLELGQHAPGGHGDVDIEGDTARRELLRGKRFGAASAKVACLL
jgi:hypothetical protein